MNVIAWFLFTLAQMITPCNHMFFADKVYAPKSMKGFGAYILREHCINCGKIRYPLSRK